MHWNSKDGAGKEGQGLHNTTRWKPPSACLCHSGHRNTLTGPQWLNKATSKQQSGAAGPNHLCSCECPYAEKDHWLQVSDRDTEKENKTKHNNNSNNNNQNLWYKVLLLLMTLLRAQVLNFFPLLTDSYWGWGHYIIRRGSKHLYPLSHLISHFLLAEPPRQLTSKLLDFSSLHTPCTRPSKFWAGEMMA